jgi:hypothetical protein
METMLWVSWNHATSACTLLQAHPSVDVRTTLLARLCPTARPPKRRHKKLFLLIFFLKKQLFVSKRACVVFTFPNNKVQHQHSSGPASEAHYSSIA